MVLTGGWLSELVGRVGGCFGSNLTGGLLLGPICVVGEEEGSSWWMEADGAAKREKEGRLLA